MPFTLNSVVIYSRLQVSDYTPVIGKRSASDLASCFCRYLGFVGETVGALPSQINPSALPDGGARDYHSWVVLYKR
jgi:hypothetical protein